MTPTLKIPVNPAVKKYLEIRLGKNYQIGLDDWFGIIIYNFLINKTNKHFKITPKMREQSPCYFEIGISENQAAKAGIFLTEKQETSINNIVEKILRDEIFYAAVMNKKLYQIDYRITVNNILDSYDISEDELPFETLIKDFDRKKNNIIPNLYL